MTPEFPSPALPTLVISLWERVYLPNCTTSPRRAGPGLSRVVLSLQHRVGVEEVPGEDTPTKWPGGHREACSGPCTWWSSKDGL